VAPGCGREIVRVRTTKPSAAAATAVVAAGPRRPARRSASATHGAALDTCGVNVSAGTATVSARRARSTEKILDPAQAANPPAIAQEIPDTARDIFVILPAPPVTMTAYDVTVARLSTGIGPAT
jgi:hypothetical protein